MGNGRLRQFVASSISQMSVMVASAAYSWFQPIQSRLTKDPELNLTSEDISWVVAVMQVGCFISPLVSGDLTNRVGRIYLILSIGPLCLAGWAVVLFSKSMASLILVRILHGLAIGVAYTITPIYIAEITEPKYRGWLSGAFQVTWYLGMIYAVSFGPYLSYDRFVYACLPLPVIFTVTWLFMPETPYYLLMKDHDEEARRVLEYLRDGDIENEFQDMKKTVKRETSVEGSWKLLYSDKVEMKAFIIVQVVCIAKYFGGVTVIVSYALDSLSKTDSSLSADQMPILMSVLLAQLSIIAALLSDCVGRRPLLLISCFGSFVAHFFTGSYYYFYETTSTDSSEYSWALYLGMAMYCFFSDLGMGPLLRTLQSEMFGASTRGVAAGFTGGFAAFLSFMELKVYTPVNQTRGYYINFWVYSFVALVCGALLFKLLHETAGKRIGQLEDKPLARTCFFSLSVGISA